jgi:hypothetical protein
MREILEVIIKNLVNNPEEVSINENTNAKSVCYEVKVAKEDMGKVIGKQGRMAKAIRNVMKAIAIKEHQKVTVEFLD